jgi:hypothetical protein
VNTADICADRQLWRAATNRTATTGTAEAGAECATNQLVVDVVTVD